MKIYVGYQEDNSQFYNEIMGSEVSKKYTFVFSDKSLHVPFEPKERMKENDLMIADVSSPTIQLGIELGWADVYGIDIISVCVKGTAISSHLTKMSKEIVIYTEYKDLVENIEWLLESKYANSRTLRK